MPLALAVTMVLKGYSPPAPLSLRAAKVHLPRLGGAPLVARALPQAVVPAKHSSSIEKLQRARIIENPK